MPSFGCFALGWFLLLAVLWVILDLVEHPDDPNELDPPYADEIKP